MGFVADLAEDVLDLAGDVVKGVVNIVEDVVGAVGDVIEAALDDPIGTIAKVAAYATGNAWAIPLIDGASTLAKGGDLGDAIKSAAISYGTGKIATTVGTPVGKAAGDFAKTAGASATTQRIVTDVMTRAAGNTAVAIVTNQDPVKAFITGGATAAAPAILGKVPGFRESPQWVQNSVASAVGASIAGRDVNEAVVGSLIRSADVVGKALREFDPDGTKLNEGQRAIAADAIFRTTQAALAGKDPSEALTASLTRAATKALGEYAKDGIKVATNAMAEYYANISGTGDQLNAIVSKSEAAANQYNGVRDSLSAALNEEQRLKAEMDAAVARHNSASDNTYFDSANAAINAYNNFVTALNKSYNEYYKPELDRLSQELTTYDQQYEELTGFLKRDQGKLQEEINRLTQQLDPVYANSNRAFAESLMPGFDAEAYRRLNPDIPQDADPYFHYITEGMFKGLKGTQEQLTQVRTDFAARQFELDAQEFVYDGSGAKTQAAAEAEAKAKGYNTYTFDGKTNTIIPPAELEARNKLLQQVLQAEGKTINTATDEDIRKAVDIVNNVPQQKVLDGISIQDVLSGNYSGWRDGKYVTHFDTKDGKGTATFDPKTGIYNLDAVIVTADRIEKRNVGAGSLQDLATNDPEAYLQMASQFDEQAKGDFGDFFTNSLNAAVLAAHATGNKTLANNIQQTLSIGSQGIGEQVENIAKFIASTTGMSYDNAMVRAGKAMQEWGAANQSANTKAQEDAIIKAVEDAKGVGNKLGAFFKTGANNFGGALTLIAKEGVQQILPLWAARGVMTAGKLIAYSTNAAIEGIESWGSNAGEVYETAIKQGRSEDEARAMASKVGFQSFVVSSVANGIGDIPVVRRIIGDGVSASFGDIIKGSGRDAVTEYFDELLTNANNQRTLYGQVNWDYATTAATIGAGIGAGTTAGILTGMSFKDAVVAQDMDGRNVTLNEFLEGTRNVNVNTINMGASIGTTKNGNDVTLGTALAMPVVSGVSYSTVTSSVPSFLTNQSIVVGKDALGNNITIGNLLGQVTEDVGFDQVYKSLLNKNEEQRKEAQVDFISKAFRDAGYTNFNKSDAESLVNTATPGGAQFFTQIAQQYANPRVTTADEAREMMRSIGYINPTDEEVAEFIGSIPEDESRAKVADYVAPRMVTEADARAFFQARGYVPNEQELAQFVRQGRDVLKTQVEQELGAYVDPRQVTKEEAKQFFESLGYRPTDDEIAQFVKQGPDVQQGIVQQLLGEYVDPRFVDESEVRAAYEALGLKRPTQEDIRALMGQYDETLLGGKAETSLDRARYNSIMFELDQLARRAGVDPSVLDAIKNDLNSQITALGGDLAALRGEVKEQIGALQTDVQAKYNALSAEQRALADALAQQGVDLNTAIDLASQRAAQALGETEQRISSQVQQVADLLGKPARQVTQADIDYVNRMIGGQQTNLAYDANQDGKVDQTDIDFMTRLMAGNVDQPWTPAAGTVWAPTGLFAQQAAEAEKIRQQQAAEAERTRQAQAAQAQAARRLQLQGQARQGLMSIAQQLPQFAEQSTRRIDPIYAQTRYHSFQAPLFQTNLWGEQIAQNPTNQPNQFRMASGGYLDPQGEPQTWDDIYRMLK